MEHLNQAGKGSLERSRKLWRGQDVAEAVRLVKKLCIPQRRAEISGESCQCGILPLTHARMIRFSLFGIPVEIQPFFWLTMGMLGGAFNADSTQGLINMVLFMIAGAISILVHEFGHALTIRRFGLPTTVTLEAFGGYATYPAGILTRKKSFLVTAAGPVSQLLLALLVVLVFRNLPENSLNQNASYFFDRLIIISIFWALLNLLPVMPLDGGQLLNAALGPLRIKITLWVTIITAVVVGVGMFIIFKSFLFPLFLGYFAYLAYKELQENKWR